MTETLENAEFLLSGAWQRHAAYARLANLGPVHRIRLWGGPALLVTGYDMVRQALSDPKLQGRTGSIGDRRNLPEHLHLGMNAHMLNSDPPDHTRLRRLLLTVFTPRRIERLRPRIQEITDELLDAMAGKDEVDLIQALASPLPFRVVSELVGVPGDMVASFLRWTETLTHASLPLAELTGAANEMIEYTRVLLAQKRRDPGDDLLSGLVAVRDNEDRLTEHELTSMVFLLMIGGYETTVSLLSSAVLSLDTHPEQLARLRADPGLLPVAIEEILRYESPLQIAVRYATQPTELAGEQITTGSVVVVSLLAANRDPARFDRPDLFDIDRPGNRNLTFGHGIHHCLGAPLARLEGVVAIGSLLARFPELRLAHPLDALEWRESVLMHGLTALPVRLR